jgi:hypothetical protein
MQTLRRRFAWTRRDAFSRPSLRHGLALFLIVIVPGGLVVPICYGIYGAIRHTLGGKVSSRLDANMTTIPEARER